MKPARIAWPAPAPALATPAGERPVTRAAGRSRALAWWGAGLLLATLCAVLLLAGQSNPYLGDYGDDAEFLVLGQGLATGQGYAWVNNPERPAHNRYPPGYPLWLAAALTLSGTAGVPAAAIVPAKLATAATLLGAAVLLWPVARRRLDAPWAAGAVALFLLNPFALRFAGEVMSDVPYVLVLLGTLAWADRLSGTESRPGLWRWVAFGALLALGAYVRSIGLAAAGGALAWALWLAWRRREWRPAVAVAAFALLMLPWWLRDAGLAGGWRYLQELFAAQYFAPAEGTVSSSDLLTRAAGNIAFLAGKPGVFGLGGMLVGAAAAAVVAWGYLRTLRHAGGAAEWVAVALVLAVLFWPIKTGRYLLPVIPLLGIYAIAGSVAVARLRPGLKRAGTALVGAGLVLFVFLEGAYAGREALANQRALRAAPGAAGYYAARPQWARYLEAAAWLGEHAGPQDMSLGRRHFALYVYSGHYADKYRFDTTADELDYLFAGTMRKYVVEDAFPELRGEFGPLPAAVRARGGDLILRYETAAPAVRVWELVRRAGPPAP
jgi:hypothetical protein